MITAVDVGATKVLIAQFKDGLRPLNEVRFPTPVNVDDFLQQLLLQLQQLEDISEIVVGIPGQIASDGTVLRCGNLPWQNLALKAYLAQYFKCPIYIQNDANLAGLAEVNALSPLPSLGLYLTLSTGVGSSLIIDGKLPPQIAHCEAGHMVLHYNGQWREWEDLASGKVIAAHFGKLVRDLNSPDQWQWIAERVSLGLSLLIPAVQPNVIVFGGGVGNYFDNFKPYVVELLQQRLPAYIPLPPLLTAQHADEAVIYGCYYHATHQKAQ